jgi:hypothetical protein
MTADACKAILTCGAMLLWSLPVWAADSVRERAPAWPDTFIARLEALALLQTLIRAVLTLPDGAPFSEVVETYTADVLAFPVPRP